MVHVHVRHYIHRVDVTIPVNIVALLSSKSKDDAFDEQDDTDADTKKIIVPRKKENCKDRACASRSQKVTY